MDDVPSSCTRVLVQQQTKRMRLLFAILKRNVSQRQKRQRHWYRVHSRTRRIVERAWLPRTPSSVNPPKRFRGGSFGGACSSRRKVKTD